MDHLTTSDCQKKNCNASGMIFKVNVRCLDIVQLLGDMMLQKTGWWICLRVFGKAVVWKISIQKKLCNQELSLQHLDKWCHVRCSVMCELWFRMPASSSLLSKINTWRDHAERFMLWSFKNALQVFKTLDQQHSSHDITKKKVFCFYFHQLPLVKRVKSGGELRRSTIPLDLSC